MSAVRSHSGGRSGDYCAAVIFSGQLVLWVPSCHITLWSAHLCVCMCLARAAVPRVAAVVRAPALRLPRQPDRMERCVVSSEQAIHHRPLLNYSCDVRDDASGTPACCHTRTISEPRLVPPRPPCAQGLRRGPAAARAAADQRAQVGLPRCLPVRIT